MEMPLDDPRLKAAGWAVVRNGAVATIHLIGDDGEPEDRIAARVAVKDDKLQFLPQRSSDQRKVLARINAVENP
jgi:hypothetical protein